MNNSIEALISVVATQQQSIEAQSKQMEEQGRQIAAQGEHIGLLVQAVVMLLGEETGTPVESDSTAEPGRTDLDGKPY